MTSEANFGPGAAEGNQLGTDLPERKQLRAFITRNEIKSSVNIYIGNLLASFSLTGRFAKCLLLPLELVLALAWTDQRSLFLASALMWRFCWDQSWWQLSSLGIVGVILNRKIRNCLKIPLLKAELLSVPALRFVSLGTVVTFPSFFFFLVLKLGLEMFSPNSELFLSQTKRC